MAEKKDENDCEMGGASYKEKKCKIAVRLPIEKGKKCVWVQCMNTIFKNRLCYFHHHSGSSMLEPYTKYYDELTKGRNPNMDTQMDSNEDYTKWNKGLTFDREFFAKLNTAKQIYLANQKKKMEEEKDAIQMSESRVKTELADTQNLLLVANKETELKIEQLKANQNQMEDMFEYVKAITPMEQVRHLNDVENQLGARKKEGEEQNDENNQRNKRQRSQD